MFRHLAHMLGHLRHTPDLEQGPLPVLDAQEIAHLERDLEGLGSVLVPAAARERGWSALRSQAQRRAPGRLPAAARDTGRRTWRLAAAGALVLAAAVLGAVGLVNLRQDRQVAVTPQTATSAPSTASGSVTSLLTPSTAVTSPSTPGTLPVTTLPGTSVITTAPATTVGPTPTTGTGTTTPTTTAPATTTSRQLMAKEEKERQALAVVGYLAQAVAAGDGTRAQSLVAESAAFGLSELMASLRDPQSHRVSLLGDHAADEVRVLLEVVDRIPTDTGVPEELTLRFLCTVRTGQDGALITAIYAAP